MKNFNEVGKITLAYFISTIVYIIVLNLVVKDELITTRESLRVEWIGTLAFSLVLLLLVWIFKIKFKTFLIFLGIILILFIPLTINRESLWNSLWSTPDTPVLIYLTFLSLVTTLPFHGLIWSLTGYRCLDLLNIIFPRYLIIMGILGYIITKIRGEIKKRIELILI